MGRIDVARDWVFQRCREVQFAPDGYIDLWAREHYKSTIITFGLTIQDILNDPDTTIGIFSHTRPIAKGFLRQIKAELEANQKLRAWFPEIIWDNPQAQAPKWSEDDGITVHRNSNPKEQTVEAWGIVDGQPTGKHFKRLIYDDVVTQESVTTPEMIAKVTRSWELSLNLGAEGGSSRYIGTRYHFNDTYREIIGRGAAIPRIYPATTDGAVNGPSVLLSQEMLAKKRRDMGPYIYGCQMLLDPKADSVQGFNGEWLRWTETQIDGDGLNVYMLVDPASAKKASSDYTAAWVIGLAADQNYYVLDMVRDRLNLTERADMVFAMHRRWRPRSVGYERYGLQADVEHFQDRMRRDNYRFGIVELGGPMPKADRIKRLIPLFEQGRIWLPPVLHKIDCEGVRRDLVVTFIEEEYKAFPVGLHDDMLDALARMLDEDFDMIWPLPEEEPVQDRYARRTGQPRRALSAWSV